LESNGDWSPPEGLERFINAGPPPLSIGFGSVIDAAAEELLRSILAALSATGQRAVLVSGWNNYTGPLPDNVFAVKSVPYDWLFPRVSAAIHAAGAGTVAEALRAGIPSICVPFAGEQKFYAKRLEELGIATSPIDRRHVTTEGLAAAINQVTQDQAMRDRAKSFGDVVGRENGVREAVRLLRLYLDRSPQRSSPDAEFITNSY
jgi:UDP:flavonoid glycosyltransferase YjiC (YdhE family)